MDEQWHFVPVPFLQSRASWEERNEFKAQLADWCNDHSHGRWSYGRPSPRSDERGKVIHTNTGFFFKGPNDAILFKLTWGGH